VFCHLHRNHVFVPPDISDEMLTDLEVSLGVKGVRISVAEALLLFTYWWEQQRCSSSRFHSGQGDPEDQEIHPCC